MSGPVPPIPHMPSWLAQEDFAFTGTALYYCNRCSTVTRTSTLFWQIMGSNPCSENEFSGYGLMCSKDRGTGRYPKPTVSNLPLPTQIFLKTSRYVSLSSTQTSPKKFLQFILVIKPKRSTNFSNLFFE